MDYFDYYKFLKMMDSPSKNKNELIKFLNSAKQQLLSYGKGHNQQQEFEIVCCLNNLDTLIELIEYKY